MSFGQQQAAVEVHLHIRVATEQRKALVEFLTEAIPFYQQPGGIRVSLWESESDPTRLIELIEYATEEAFEKDRVRVDTDPTMQGYLARWRRLLAEPVRVETLRRQPVGPPMGAAPASTGQPTLTTARLTLRPFTLGDCADVARLAGDREIAASTLLIPHPYEHHHAESWIATHAEAFAANTLANFAITLRQDDGGSAAGSVVGAIGLVFKPQFNHAEMGYWVGKAYWGRGYCTEAAAEILRWGLVDRGLNRVHAHHFDTNPASGAIMRKIGMKYEGTLRRHICKWGTYHDAVCYGILRDELANR